MLVQVLQESSERVWSVGGATVSFTELSFPTGPVGPSTDLRLGLELQNKHRKREGKHCEARMMSWSSSHDHHISEPGIS